MEKIREGRPAYATIAKHWKYYLPPARPSKKTLQIYEKCVLKIKSKKNPKVLILGATPELRELALKNGCEVTTADISMDMLNAMTLLMNQNVDRGKEIIVNTDWLTMPLKENYYDLILGDDSINPLNYDNFEKFLLKIKQLLRANGRVCMEVVTRTKQKPKSVLNIFEEYRKKSNRYKTNLWGDLLLKLMNSLEVFDKKRKKCVFKKLVSICYELYNEGKITKEEYECFKIRFENAEYTFTLPEKNKFESILRKYFNILRIDYGEEAWFKEEAPIYLLSPKIDGIKS